MYYKDWLTFIFAQNFILISEFFEAHVPLLHFFRHLDFPYFLVGINYNIFLCSRMLRPPPQLLLYTTIYQQNFFTTLRIYLVREFPVFPHKVHVGISWFLLNTNKSILQTNTMEKETLQLAHKLWK